MGLPEYSQRHKSDSLRGQVKTCLHYFVIRTREATYIKPAGEWLYLAGPFYRNEKNERCVAHGNAFYSIEDSIEEETTVVCYKCGERLVGHHGH